MKTILVLFFISGLLNHLNAQDLITTNGQTQNYQDSTIRTDEYNVPLDSLQYYYPPELFVFKDTSKNVLQINCDFINEIFSSILFRLKEPLLYNKDLNKEIYRLTFHIRFLGTVCIRIEKSLDSMRFFIKGSYEKTGTLDSNQWNEFKKKLDSIDFWNLPSVNDILLNGSKWILEGKTGKKYNFVYRWSLRKNTYFRELCGILFDIVGIIVNHLDQGPVLGEPFIEEKSDKAIDGNK